MASHDEYNGDREMDVFGQHSIWPADNRRDKDADQALKWRIAYHSLASGELIG
jgi:hypothetical protein